MNGERKKIFIWINCIKETFCYMWTEVQQNKLMEYDIVSVILTLYYYKIYFQKKYLYFPEHFEMLIRAYELRSK